MPTFVERWQNIGIQEIANQLIAAKGVKHGKLNVTTSGNDLPT